ncbi:MAG: VCBS repeat-containing protein [Bacteroidetes bacterium]|nr:VCBS repeat-containing protein [Bacteroidota bacterium]
MKNFVIIVQFLSNYVLSQTPQVILISPDFNEITPTMNPEIRATFNVDMDSSTFDELSFTVFGERSGYHSGDIRYTKITRTALFNSYELFNAGERVTVLLSNQIRSLQGDTLIGFSWVFRIPAGIAPVNFTEPIAYGGGGDFMQCTDMNNDNYPDLVTSSGIIWLNDGSGVFSESWIIQDVTFDQPLLADDFNRDGNMDVFYYGFDGLKIGIGDGMGNFTFSTKPFWFRDFISADFNGDGYPDVAGLIGVTYIPPDSTTLDWAIAFNDGTGEFNNTTLFKVGGGGYPVSLIAADLDNDGDIDIVIASQPHVIPQGIFGINGIIIGINNGYGIFDIFDLYPEEYSLRIGFPSYLYCSDYNNDEFNDVVVISSSGGVVALNSKTGTFGYDTSNVRGFWPAELSSPITGGDINGDTWIDLMVSGYEWPPEFGIPYYAVNLNNVSYFPGFWNNDFNDTLPTGHILAVEVADLDGDLDLDLVHCGAGIYITFSEDSATSVRDNLEVLNDFYLYQNYPNPFNNMTTINLETNANQFTRISIYNLLGEEVRFLEEKVFYIGNHRITWDGKDNKGNNLPSGVYIIHANSFNSSQHVKAILIK